MRALREPSASSTTPARVATRGKLRLFETRKLQGSTLSTLRGTRARSFLLLLLLLTLWTSHTINGYYPSAVDGKPTSVERTTEYMIEPFAQLSVEVNARGCAWMDS